MVRYVAAHLQTFEGAVKFCVAREFWPNALLVNAYEMSKATALRGARIAREMGWPLYVDSGGYQALRQGADPPLNLIARRYRVILSAYDNAYFFALDKPPGLKAPPDVYEKAERYVVETVRALRKVVGYERLIPVVHFNVNDKLFRRWLEAWAVGAEYIAVGGTAFSAARPYAPVIVRHIKEVAEDWGVKIHWLGAFCVAAARAAKAYSTDHSVMQRSKDFTITRSCGEGSTQDLATAEKWWGDVGYVRDANVPKYARAACLAWLAIMRSEYRDGAAGLDQWLK